tara:strand:- start:14240 stop:14605 length:366 start_codon:yes stop_codon:yes gene_type:complete
MEFHETIKDILVWREANPELFKLGQLLAGLVLVSYVIVFSINSTLEWVFGKGKRLWEIMTRKTKGTEVQQSQSRGVVATESREGIYRASRVSRDSAQIEILSPRRKRESSKKGSLTSPLKA